jgi:hypothetical protein
MPSRRTLAIGAVIAAVVLVAAVTAAVRADDLAHRPHLDATARRTVPAIAAYLRTPAAGTWAGTLAEKRPGAARWFCGVTPIESRYIQGRLRVGIVAQCAEYLRDGDHLVTDAGYATPLVIALQRSGTGWVPVHIQHPGDGTRFAWSVTRMFTPDGARVAMRASTNGVFPDPAPDARTAFGLPANASIVQG